MTKSNIAILIGGLIFSILGFYICRFYKWRKTKGYLPLIIGLILIYITTIGPLSVSKKKMEEIIMIDPNNVTSIVITPVNNASYPNRVKVDRVLKDIELVKKLCNALRHINIDDEGLLKNPDSVCLVKINTVDLKNIVFEVKQAGQRTCLTVDSNGATGWHYGDLEAFEFGQVLNEVLKQY